MSMFPARRNGDRLTRRLHATLYAFAIAAWGLLGFAVFEAHAKVTAPAVHAGE